MTHHEEQKGKRRVVPFAKVDILVKTCGDYSKTKAKAKAVIRW